MSDDVFGFLVVMCLFFPSLFGLMLAYTKVWRRKVDSSHSSFKEGVETHIANTIFAPALPGLLLYVDNKTGGGSVASLLAIPILPITWWFFIVGCRQVNMAAQENKQRLNRIKDHQ